MNNDKDEVSFNATSENEIEAVKHKLSPIVGDANSLPKKAKSFVSCAVGRMSK